MGSSWHTQYEFHALPCMTIIISKQNKHMSNVRQCNNQRSITEVKYSTIVALKIAEWYVSSLLSAAPKTVIILPLKIHSSLKTFKWAADNILNT